MEFTKVNLKEFRKFVKQCRKYVAGKKSGLGILRCVAIKITQDEQKLVATNLEDCIEVPITALVGEPVEICVMHYVLNDLLATLTDEYIVLAVNDEDTFPRLIIGSEIDNNITELIGITTEEFPPLDNIKKYIEEQKK